ncbi:MAG TPA: sigma-70 family RNA polymerase sigma factor [Myxococcales bacterium]
MTSAADASAKPHLRVVREGEPEGPGDWDLITLHLAGDAQAFSALVRRYQKPVYRLALRYAHDADEAEDLAQRTFLRVLDHAARLRPDQPFRAFVFRVAANLCKNHLRDRARLVFGVPIEVAAPATGESLEDKEKRSRLRTSLAKLPLRQRQVVSLRIDAELPFAQIAESLRITENNAKVTFHHAMRKLQALFAEEEAKEEQR